MDAGAGLGARIGDTLLLTCGTCEETTASSLIARSASWIKRVTLSCPEAVPQR
jgi:hypothetical protein